MGSKNTTLNRPLSGNFSLISAKDYNLSRDRMRSQDAIFMRLGQMIVEEFFILQRDIIDKLSIK